MLNEIADIHIFCSKYNFYGIGTFVLYKNDFFGTEVSVCFISLLLYYVYISL